MDGQVNDRHYRGWAFAALTAAGCFWGTGFFLGKIALRELSVPHMIFYRLFIGSVAFLPILALRPVRVRRQDWGMFLAGSLLGIPVMFLIQFQGLAYTTVSHAALMVGTNPILLALSGFLLFREKLTAGGWYAVAASTAGVAMIVLRAGTVSARPPGTGPSVLGDLLVMVSLLAGLAWILVSKHLMRRYPPLTVSAYITVTGTVMLMAWVLLRNGVPPVALSATTWMAVALQGIFATMLATVFWNWGLSHVQTGHAGVFMNFEPVIGTILGVTVLHDPFGVWTVLGGVLIVGAAAVMTWRG